MKSKVSMPLAERFEKGVDGDSVGEMISLMCQRVVDADFGRPCGAARGTPTMAVATAGAVGRRE
jgi:hypothetical protein